MARVIEDTDVEHALFLLNICKVSCLEGFALRMSEKSSPANVHLLSGTNTTGLVLAKHQVCPVWGSAVLGAMLQTAKAAGLWSLHVFAVKPRAWCTFLK